MTLLAILLFAAPLAKFIPLTVLSAIFVCRSLTNMGDGRKFRECEAVEAGSGTWLVTFLLTVFADLTVAVEAGMIMGALGVHQQSDPARPRLRG